MFTKSTNIAQQTYVDPRKMKFDFKGDEIECIALEENKLLHVDLIQIASAMLSDQPIHPLTKTSNKYNFFISLG